MKIGIITFHRAYNCGAVLQAWALKRVLERMGNEVSILDNNHIGDDARFERFFSSYHGLRRVLSWMSYLKKQLLTLGSVDLKRYRFRCFRRCLNMEIYSTAEISKSFGCLIFGSDQIWNPDLLSEEGVGLFYGETIKSTRKIAYAASIGDSPLDSKYHARLVAATALFWAISVREPLAGEGLHDRKNRLPVTVLDPTLLLSRDDYLQVASPRRMKRGKYILAYALFATDFVCVCAEKASRMLGLPVVILAMYQRGWNNHRPHVRCAFGPAEFLAWFRDAEVILASSFHGTVFAAIFGKPFVSLRDRIDRVESRPAALLREMRESTRLVNPSTDDATFLAKLREMPQGVEMRLQSLGKASRVWLATAIEEES